MEIGMDTGTVSLFAGYNRATNEEMNALIRGLDDGQWTREFAGYFNSVRSLCNHLYVSDFNWLKRFSKLRAFTYAADPVFRSDIAFGSQVFEEIARYLVKRVELDEKIIGFSTELTGSDLEAPLRYTDSHGADHTRNFGGLVLHMFNHQTHHRGMISLYLEEMGIANNYSNLMNFV